MRGYGASVVMAKIIAAVVLTLLMVVCALPGKRVRRGYNSGYGDSGGYGRGGDERDASVSEESGGCNGSGYSGRGGYSGSRELAYNRDGRPQSSGDTRGGRSFSKATASAAASASSYSQKLKANVV